MELLSDTLKAILVGFGLFTLLYWISSMTLKERISRHNAIDESATILARYSGLLLLVLVIGHLLSGHLNVEADVRSNSQWYSFMLFPITILFTTQLLWLKKARRSTFVRMFQATMLLTALLYSKFVVAITSLHRDYMPGSNEVLSKFVLQVLLSTVVFVLALLVTHLARKRIRFAQ